MLQRAGVQQQAQQLAARGARNLHLSTARHAAGCSFCAGVSLFGAFFMFLLGILIKNNYQ